MSTSLRDQLLQAGLVSKKQVQDAERRQQHQQRQAPPKPRAGASPGHDAAVRRRDSEKIARDQVLNRQVQARAEKRSLAAQIKQLIDQHPLPPIENGHPYHFVDGAKIRQIMVDADARRDLGRGELVIVRLEGRYHLVAAAVGARVAERDADAVIAGAARESAPPDPAYEEFRVPDDLIW